MATLRKYARARGRRKARLHRKASKLRKRLVRTHRKRRRNPHPDVANVYDRDLPKRMPKRYKSMLKAALSTREGRKALARYRKFTGLPWPTDILLIETPGKGRRTLVGMGRTPNLVLARNRGERPRHIRKSGLVCTDAGGRKLMVLSGKDSRQPRQKLKFIGYAAETHYIPSRAEEAAGTFKANRYWVHKHEDEGGVWPKVYVDQAGNVVYGPGTYRVGKWIRR